MYWFFYDQVIPFWGRDRVELLMTDMDSLMLEIKTRDLWGDIDKLNFLNGDWIEQEGNPRNGKIGVFKSETGKDPITEFVGLHAKMYSFVTESDEQAHMCAKGVGKEALETLKHSDYIQCLANGTSNVIKMQSIRSINQQLYTMEMLKKGLSCNDMKRWICPDGINTEPYGYAPVEPTTLLEPGDICPWHVYEIYDDEEL